MRLIPLRYLKTTQRGDWRVFHVRISSTTYPLITSVVSEAGSAETRPRPRHGYPRPRHRHCETETRPRHGYPRPRRVCVFSPVEFALTILGSLFIQWTLVITNSLGPVKLLCYIKILLYPGCKTIKYKEIWNFGTKKITLLYRILLYQCSL